LAPFGPAVSEEKIFLTLANQKQELPLAAIFVGGMGRNISIMMSFLTLITGLFMNFELLPILTDYAN
jgi:hypothetical protein